MRTGSVVIFGQDLLRPWSVARCQENEYFGDDIAMLVSATSDSPNTYSYRRFSARCSRTTQLHSLDGADFHRSVIGPQFPIFRLYIARYGVWMRLRMTVIDHVRRMKKHRQRERSRRLKADCGTPRAPGRVASWATADPYDDAARARLQNLSTSLSSTIRHRASSSDSDGAITPQTQRAFAFFGIPPMPESPRRRATPTIAEEPPDDAAEEADAPPPPPPPPAYDEVESLEILPTPPRTKSKAPPAEEAFEDAVDGEPEG